MGFTVHCLIKNEDAFIRYALLSVIDAADKVLVYDTGSTDATVSIVRELQAQYQGKIMLEEKGPCDKARHTALRQEMIVATTTEWFMILDGDEVWTKRGMAEAIGHMREGSADIIETYFYECVGDIYHTHKKPGYKTIRFARTSSVRWQGEYGLDLLVDATSGVSAIDCQKTVQLCEKYWHMTHLVRSSIDAKDYSSGGPRQEKIRLTYTWIGKKISESVPEVFGDAPDLHRHWLSSLVELARLFARRFQIARIKK